MGYDHFALLCVWDTENDNKEFDNNFTKLIEKIALTNKFDNEPSLGIYIIHIVNILMKTGVKNVILLLTKFGMYIQILFLMYMYLKMMVNI